VIAEGDTAPLQDGQAGWTFVIDGTPKSVTAVITDAEGKVVFESEAEAASGVQNFVWDGKDAAGEQLPPGTYTLQVTALDDADEQIDVDVAAKGRVTGVDLSTTEPALLVGDVRVPLAAVISVRQHEEA
jgi:flagellar basal-body rod modification protein FlgD